MFKNVRFDFANARDKYYTAFITDDELGQIQVYLQHNLCVGSGYGIVLNYYKDNKLPLAKNLARIIHYYYEVQALTHINGFLGEIQRFYPDLLSKQVVDCTKRHLHDLL